MDDLNVDDFIIKDDLEAYKDFVRRLVDGEPVNKNPLVEIPKPSMKLYEYASDFIDSVFFDAEEELNEYVKTHNQGFFTTSIVEYLGEFAGKHDVIRYDYGDESYSYVALKDRYGYIVYNEERSTYCGQYVWEFFYGNLRSVYEAFKDRGIVLENDIYGKIDEDKKLFMHCLNKRLEQIKKNNN